MRNIFCLTFIILVAFTFSCKKKSIYTNHFNKYDYNSFYSKTEGQRENVVRVELNQYSLQKEAIKQPLQNNKRSVLMNTDFSTVETKKAFLSTKDEELKNNLINRSTVNKSSVQKKKKNVGSILFGIVFFVLLAALLAGLLLLVSAIFPGLGLTFKGIIIFIAALYTLGFLVVLGGSMPKEHPVLVTPEKPCVEIQCPSFGCENGIINTHKGKITCVRCHGKGIICK